MSEFEQQALKGLFFGLLGTIKKSNGISIIFQIEISKRDPDFPIGKM